MIFGKSGPIIAGDIALIVRFRAWPAIMPDGLNPVTVKPSVMVMLVNVAFISPVFWIGTVRVTGLDGATRNDPSGKIAEMFGPLVIVMFSISENLKLKSDDGCLYMQSFVAPSDS